MCSLLWSRTPRIRRWARDDQLTAHHAYGHDHAHAQVHAIDDSPHLAATRAATVFAIANKLADVGFETKMALE